METLQFIQKIIVPKVWGDLLKINLHQVLTGQSALAPQEPVADNHAHLADPAPRYHDKRTVSVVENGLTLSVVLFSAGNDHYSVLFEVTRDGEWFGMAWSTGSPYPPESALPTVGVKAGMMELELNTAEDPDDPPSSVMLKFELGFD